jgi:hypothetical protein
MFQALLAHLQEALHNRHLVYCVSVSLPGRTKVGVQPADITRTQYIKCRFCSASWRWASNARKTQRPLILNKLNKMCITLGSLYWCNWIKYYDGVSHLQTGSTWYGLFPLLCIQCSVTFCNIVLLFVTVFPVYCAVHRSCIVLCLLVMYCVCLYCTVSACDVLCLLVLYCVCLYCTVSACDVRAATLRFFLPFA